MWWQRIGWKGQRASGCRVVISDVTRKVTQRTSMTRLTRPQLTKSAEKGFRGEEEEEKDDLWCGDLFDHCLVHPPPFWDHALVKKQYLGVNVIWNCRWFWKSSFESPPPPSICLGKVNLEIHLLPRFVPHSCCSLKPHHPSSVKLKKLKLSLVSLIFIMLISVLVLLMLMEMKLTQLSSSPKWGGAFHQYIQLEMSKYWFYVDISPGPKPPESSSYEASWLLHQPSAQLPSGRQTPPPSSSPSGSAPPPSAWWPAHSSSRGGLFWAGIHPTARPRYYTIIVLNFGSIRIHHLFKKGGFPGELPWRTDRVQE